MEFCFSMPTGYKLKEIEALNRLALKRSKGLDRSVPVMRALLTVVGVLLMVVGFVSLTTGSAAESGGALVVAVELMVGAFCFTRGFLQHRIAAISNRGAMIKKMGKYEIRLTEKGITEKAERGERTRRWEYSQIESAILYKGIYFLLLDEHYALGLPPRAMTKGTLPALEELLTRKLGYITKL